MRYTIGSVSRGLPVSASMKICGVLTVTIRVSGSSNCEVMAVVSEKKTFMLMLVS